MVSNGARNDSFLVLDVRDNTFRLGGSMEKDRDHNSVAVSNAETISSSSDEGSPAPVNRKRASKGRGDPDWFPEKIARKNNSWSFRGSKLNPGSSSNPTECQPVPRESRDDGTPVSRPCPPPEHLVKLLKVHYGWRVEFDRGLGEFVYICPAGIAHCSLMEAFRSFLHGTSKYRERFPVSYRSSEYWPNDENKGKRIFTVEEESLLLKHQPVDEDYRKSPSIHPRVPSPDASLDNESSWKNPCRNLTVDSDRDRKLHALRRSCRISGNRANGDATKDKGEVATTSSQAFAKLPEACHRDECFKNGGSNHDFRKMSAREKDRTSGSVGFRRPVLTNTENIMVDTEVDAAMEVKDGCSNGKGKSFGDNSQAITSQTKISGTNTFDDVLGTRRSMRINGEQVPADDELNTGIWGDENFLDWSGFTTNRMAYGNKEMTTTSFRPEEQLKQADAKKYGFQEFKLQKQSESRNFKKNEYTKKPSTEIFSGSVGIVSAGIPVLDSDGNKRKRRNGGCGLVIRRNKKINHHEHASIETKLCLLSWLIDSGVLTVNEKVVCITKNNKGKVSSGLVTREGIGCECCKEVVPLLKFVDHAGSSHSRPWDCIFLLSGKTLLQCLKETWEKEKQQRKVGFYTVITDPDPSDDTCGICSDGGQLICCDSCPSTFHQECLMLKVLPEGSWSCPYCRCTFCLGAQHGSDKTLETLTLMLICKQCGCKYHEECKQERENQETSRYPSLFCGKNCRKIADRLSEMLGTSYPVDGGFSWTILKHYEENEKVSSIERLEKLSFIMECNVKLSMALTILNECFVPLIDQRTGVDMLCQAVYNCGSNFNRLNYEGFYTIILEKDDEIISAASLRIHGTKLAEMPFIGTRPIFRRQGMCRRLLKAIENMLSSLYVEKLIIPAIPDLLETWKTSFSFEHLELSHVNEIRKLSMVTFPGTTLLQKPINNTGATNQGGGWRSHDFKDRMESTTESPRIIRDSRITTDSLTNPLPENFNGSITKTSSLRNTFVRRGSTAFFPSVNDAGNISCSGTGIVPGPNSPVNRWSETSSEATDIHTDAVRSSLAFDSLFRIRS